jgi:hypothetical protein
MKMKAPLPVAIAASCICLLATSCGASAARKYPSYESAVSLPPGEPLGMSETSPAYYQDEIGYEMESDAGGGAYGAADAGEVMAYAPAPAAAMGAVASADVTTAVEMPPDLEGVKWAQAAKKPEVQPAQPAPETKPKEAHDRLILYTAEMGIAVFRVEEKIEDIRKKIGDWGGYLVSMDSNQIVFRVPAEIFEEALEALGQMGDVTYRNVQGTDVTEEFMDLQIRLKNSEAVRDRLLELLSQAKTINESLQVEHELERITEKIELMKGRIKYLSEAALYSKITVHLAVKKKAKKPIPPVYAPFRWIQEIGLDNLFNF